MNSLFSNFEGEKDGITFKIARKDDHDIHNEIVDFWITNFMQHPNDPSIPGIQSSIKKEFNKSQRTHLTKILKESAHEERWIYAKDMEKEKIVGIHISNRVYRADGFTPRTRESLMGEGFLDDEAWMFWVLDASWNHRWIFDLFPQCNVADHINGINVLKEYQHRGIGMEMARRHSDFVAATDPPDLVFAECSSNFSTRIYETLGFHLYKLAKYDDFEDEKGNKMYNNNVHSGIRGMYRLFKK